MKRFFKLASKFFIVSLCAVALCISSLAYNSKDAIEFVKQHGKDFEYNPHLISCCLNRGGVYFSKDTDIACKLDGRQRITDGVYYSCWGLFKDLEGRRFEIAINELSIDEFGRLPWSTNEGKVKPGDILFVKDPNPDDKTDTYLRAYIVAERNSDDKYVMLFIPSDGGRVDRSSFFERVSKQYGGKWGWTCAHFLKEDTQVKQDAKVEADKVTSAKYDPQQALNYARNHWDDGEGLCAEFASKCLRAGGMRFSTETDKIGERVAFDGDIRCGGYYWGCWGLYHDLQARTDVEMHEIKMFTNEFSGSYAEDNRPIGRTLIPWQQEGFEIKPGDVLFKMVPEGSVASDGEVAGPTDIYEHVMIIGERVGDYVKVYAHNRAQNNDFPGPLRSGDKWICAHFIDR